MGKEGKEFVEGILNRVQRVAIIRMGLLVFIVLALVGAMAYFSYRLIPKSYTLTITGGDVLGNRHYLAKLLRDEAVKNGVTLNISPLHGSMNSYQHVSSGKLDMAFVQGGTGKKFPNVRHVATVMPEMMHLLVKSEIADKGIRGLKGKRINLGSKEGGTRILANTVLKFSGLDHRADFVETNYKNEELMGRHPSKLPDAIFLISALPSYVAQYMVRERGYWLMELPFPRSLSLRYGWVSNSSIPGYTYSVTPPIPDRDIKTIGANLLLIANANTDSQAIFKVLETLYSPLVSSELKQKLDEKMITIPPGFPISSGTMAYLQRNEPFFSMKTISKMQNTFGMVMSVLTTLLVLIKWLKGKTEEETQDYEFMDYIRELTQIEREIGKLEEKSFHDPSQLALISKRLTRLKIDALEKYPDANLNDPGLMDRILSLISATRKHAAVLMKQAGTGKGQSVSIQKK